MSLRQINDLIWIHTLVQYMTRLSHCGFMLKAHLHTVQLKGPHTRLMDVDGKSPAMSNMMLFLWSAAAVSGSGVHFNIHTRIYGTWIRLSASVTERQCTSINILMLDPQCEVLFIPWVMETVTQASDVSTKPNLQYYLWFKAFYESAPLIRNHLWMVSVFSNK